MDGNQLSALSEGSVPFHLKISMHFLLSQGNIMFTGWKLLVLYLLTWQISCPDELIMEKVSTVLKPLDLDYIFVLLHWSLQTYFPGKSVTVSDLIKPSSAVFGSVSNRCLLDFNDNLGLFLTGATIQSSSGTPIFLNTLKFE